VPLSRDSAARARQLANLRKTPPPTPEGNRRAVKHGGYAAVARERLDAHVRSIYEALAADVPLRDGRGELPAADHALVVLLAKCLARLEDVEANVSAYGVLDESTDDVRPAAKLERELRAEAASYLDRLGMSPKARVAIGVAVAQGMTAAEQLDSHLSSRYGGDAR
jgi:hypothetical protein